MLSLAKRWFDARPSCSSQSRHTRTTPACRSRLAIDRLSNFTFVEFDNKAGKMNAASFLEHAIEAFPYHIHTVLTDNGVAFANLPKNRTGPKSRYVGLHIFGRTCKEHGITHKLTKPYHPWGPMAKPRE